MSQNQTWNSWLLLPNVLTKHKEQIFKTQNHRSESGVMILIAAISPYLENWDIEEQNGLFCHAIFPFIHVNQKI